MDSILVKTQTNTGVNIINIAFRKSRTGHYGFFVLTITPFNGFFCLDWRLSQYIGHQKDMFAESGLF